MYFLESRYIFMEITAWLRIHLFSYFVLSIWSSCPVVFVAWLKVAENESITWKTILEQPIITKKDKIFNQFYGTTSWVAWSGTFFCWRVTPRFPAPDYYFMSRFIFFWDPKVWRFRSKTCKNTLRKIIFMLKGTVVCASCRFLQAVRQ